MGAPKINMTEEYEKLVIESLRPLLDWKRIMVCDQISPGEVIGIALKSRNTHVCQSSHPYFAHDLNTSAVMLGDEEKFISFPLSSILNPEKISKVSEKSLTQFEYDFSQASEKSEILQGIESVLTQMKISNSIMADIIVIADELSTNAVFNAPFVDISNTSAGASREDSSVRMNDGKSAKIFLGANETRLVIGCRDPFGTLNLMKLFERVKNCYDTSVAESMNMTGRGGAGIGSFMVYNSAASYFAVVNEGHCTMIMCALPLKMSSRTRLELPKNLHFIIKK